jgi:putative hydrolase of the HAD superfamily
MIDVVFLDAGETLLRPHPSFAELFAEICRRSGYALDPRRVREVQEALAPHLIDLAEETGVEHPSLSPEGSRRFWTYLYRRFLSELDISDEGVADLLYATFSKTSTYRLFEDALPALHELQGAGYRLGLISNFEEWLEEMLVELEVGDLLDVTVISGVEGIEKPDARIYELALQRAGVDAGAAVHVGDSWALDVEPALKVGMRAVLLDRVGRYKDRYTTDVPAIPTLQDLPSVLENL